MRLLLVFILCANWAIAGNIPIVSFQDLERIIQTKDDTLRVVNFWATWCKPCIEELPHFEKVSLEFKGKPVKVILVSLDFKSKADMVSAFTQRKNLKSTALLLDQGNPNEWIDKISPQWSGAIPATLFVRGTKPVYQFHEGDFDYESLKQKVQQLTNP